jgi:mxaJ protein
MLYPGPNRILTRARIACAILLACATAQVSAQTGESGSSPDELRICASEIEAPYSYKDGSGFENRIAEVVASEMGRKATFVWSSRSAIYLVRDSLDKNECDVVMGLDSGDERVLTTRPYYRSGYVLVTKADHDLDLKSWKDAKLAAMNHIALGQGSAAEAMLKKLGKYEDNANYVYSLTDFKSRRNQYLRIDPARMINEVAQGNADVAIAFGPEVGRYVKASTVPLSMRLVPADDTADGDAIPFLFDQSMAVRKGDTALLEQLNTALVKAAPRIRKVLADEGVPLAPAAG